MEEEPRLCSVLFARRQGTSVCGRIDTRSLEVSLLRRAEPIWRPIRRTCTLRVSICQLATAHGNSRRSPAPALQGSRAGGSLSPLVNCAQSFELGGCALLVDKDSGEPQNKGCRH